MRDSVLRSLEQRFLDASEKYHELHHVAVRPHDGHCPEWPEVPCESSPVANTLGFSEARWKKDIIGRHASEDLFRRPLSRQFLHFDGRLWEGAFLFDWASRPSATEVIYEHLHQRQSNEAECLETFRVLAAEAAGCFSHERREVDAIGFPLCDDDSHRWLELIHQTTIAKVESDGFCVVSRLPSNLFLASARAIEFLSEQTSTEPRSDDGQSATSNAKSEVLTTEVLPHDKLKRSERLAINAYDYATKMCGEALKDQAAYVWLKEHGAEELDSRLPRFPTWARYLRSARRKSNQSKYSRRADRPAGPSIAKADQIEHRSTD